MTPTRTARNLRHVHSCPMILQLLLEHHFHLLLLTRNLFRNRIWSRHRLNHQLSNSLLVFHLLHILLKGFLQPSQTRCLINIDTDKRRNLMTRSVNSRNTRKVLVSHSRTNFLANLKVNQMQASKKRINNTMDVTTINTTVTRKVRDKHRAKVTNLSVAVVHLELQHKKVKVNMRLRDLVDMDHRTWRAATIHPIHMPRLIRPNPRVTYNKAQILMEHTLTVSMEAIMVLAILSMVRTAQWVMVHTALIKLVDMVLTDPCSMT